MIYSRENGILKFKPRTQFGKISFAYLILIICSIFFAVYLFQLDNYAILGLPCLFLTSLFISLMINIRGVDIDLNLKKVIIYKKILWFRTRSIDSLTNYKSIYISKDKVIVGTSDYVDHLSDTYYYYLLSIVNEIDKKKIILAESQDYKNIANTAKLLSVDLKIEIKDKIYGRIK